MAEEKTADKKAPENAASAAPTFAFESFDDGDIPSGGGKNPNAERMALFDKAVKELLPGKNVRIIVPAGESPRGAALLFSRAATRIFGKDQKVIECGTYEKDGVTYAYARRKQEAK